jgi:hypothetical protein
MQIANLHNSDANGWFAITDCEFTHQWKKIKVQEVDCGGIVAKPD